jgi:multidrug efflux pump subunit AcrA (membrane-fusion protein)
MKKRELLAALLCTALLAGCGKDADDAHDEKAVAAVVPVKVATVAMHEFATEATGPGQWRSSGEIVVPAPFPAAIETLLPRVGDRVRAGETLGMLVTRESRAALRGAELLAREAKDDAARTEAARALQLAQRDLVRVPLLAPRAGLVTRRAAEPGAEVGEGADLLAITPEDALVFEARIPAALAANVRAGQSARITSDGESACEARVTRVLPMASAADQATLVWLARDRGALPVLDRTGEARIALSGAHRSLAVPADAVAEDDLDGTTRVAMVEASGIARWVALTLGAAQGGWREVKGGGLAAGARVIVEGQHGLPDSTKVAIQP